jgi:hypothetical protein
MESSIEGITCEERNMLNGFREKTRAQQKCIEGGIVLLQIDTEYKTGIKCLLSCPVRLIHTGQLLF